jgi:hypothetical protein
LDVQDLGGWVINVPWGNPEVNVLMGNFQKDNLDFNIKLIMVLQMYFGRGGGDSKSLEIKTMCSFAKPQENKKENKKIQKKNTKK